MAYSQLVTGSTRHVVNSTHGQLITVNLSHSLCFAKVDSSQP